MYTRPLCSLVQDTKAVAFNHRNRLLNAAVRLAAYGGHAYDEADLSSPAHSKLRKKQLENIVKPCCEALSEVLTSDKNLDACKEIVTGIQQLAKRAAGSGATFKLNSYLLDVLRNLRLDRSRSARKEEAEIDESDEEQKALGRDLQESNIAAQKAEHLKKAEASLLTEVTVIFLRILRTQKTHSKSVLFAALQGLAKFAMLVNIELLSEILSELELIVEQALKGQTVEPEHALWGLVTALRLLASPGGQSLAPTGSFEWIAKVEREGWSSSFRLFLYTRRALSVLTGIIVKFFFISKRSRTPVIHLFVHTLIFHFSFCPLCSARHHPFEKF